jgi:hypothetical protein
MTAYRQDPAAKLDYAQDWGPMLAANGGATIASHTVTPSGGITISASSHTATVVTYRVVASAVTPVPSNAPAATVHVVFSDGEEDERTDTFLIANR